jgi:hypothetical protein
MARDYIIRPENPQYDELAHLCNIDVTDKIEQPSTFIGQS